MNYSICIMKGDSRFMAIKSLVMYEISRKQDYIFRTNRLLENIGASYIIRDITEKPHEFFDDLASGSIIKEEALSSEEVNLPEAEAAIVGGGNATYVFPSKGIANEFSQKLSANILRYFPGIELFLIQREINWETESLFEKVGDPASGVMKKMRNELARKKNERKHAVKQMSWGIHQSCSSSGLPANEYNIDLNTNEKEAKSAELYVKEKVGRGVRNHIYRERLLKKNEYLKDERDRYTFIEQENLEETFQEEGKSYVAIVSIDGNAMGSKVSEFLNEDFKCNDDYVTSYQVFTNDIDRAYTNAFRKTIGHVMDDFDWWGKDIYSHKLDNKSFDEQMRHIVPIRPVIASGDDICFITYGKLGIEVSRIFLQYLQQETITIKGSKHRFQACAGVSIIRHNYPFWLGFDLADRLCTNAKKRLQHDAVKWAELGMGDGNKSHDTSLIDWQLVESGAVHNIEALRDDYYRNADGSQLTMRPYYIQRKDEDYKHFASYERSFLRVIKILECAQEKNDHQDESHNKLMGMSKWKQLRDVYHLGKQSVEQWKTLNQFLAHNESDSNNGAEQSLFLSYRDGFGHLHQDQDESGEVFAFFYDGLEIFDYFIRLSEVE